MDWPVDKPPFHTREAGEVTGEKWDRKRGGTEGFNLFSSLFADDCAVLFNTREDMITGANYLYHHLQKFGLLMHIGKGITHPKPKPCTSPRPSSNSAQKTPLAST